MKTTLRSLKVKRAKDDYSALAENGYGRFSCVMPALICDRCSQEWLGQRAVPIFCTAEIHRLIAASQKSLTRARFKSLSESVSDLLGKDHAFVQLRPGDQFLPFVFAIVDGFTRQVFAPIGGRLVISASIKDALVSAGITGAQFLPAISLRLQDTPDKPVRMDDFYDRVSEAIDRYRDTGKSNVSADYYLLFPESVIEPPSAFVKGAACSSCGYQKIVTTDSVSVDNSTEDCVEILNTNMILFSERALSILGQT